MTHSGKLLLKKNNYNIIDCKKCSFPHVFPYPDSKIIEDYYRSIYLEKRHNSNKKKFLKKFKDDESWFNLNNKLKLFLLNKHKSYSIYKNRSILDIGPGLGYFLSIAKKNNWSVSGVEPSALSCKLAYRKFKIKFFNNFYDKKNYESFGKFDCVHLNDVLEHLANPMDYIKMFRENLKKNGLIFITSPNDFNFFQNIYTEKKKSKMWFIQPPEHLNYFNNKNIEKVLIKNGFKILEKYSSFPLEIFLLIGMDYIIDNSIGKKIHEMRVNFDKKIYKYNPKYLLDIYRSFFELGIGREFNIIGKKI